VEVIAVSAPAWSLVATPTLGVSSALMAVSASTATDAWAVGLSILGRRDHATLMEHWNGTSWSIVPSPTPGADPGLTGVAARGSGDVYAVGNNLPSINGGVVQGLILRWNGSTWSQDTDPTDGTFSPLYAAAVVSGAANEWAVGTLSNVSLILSHG
jgi:hypothetical protein